VWAIVQHRPTVAIASNIVQHKQVYMAAQAMAITLYSSMVCALQQGGRLRSIDRLWQLP